LMVYYAVERVLFGLINYQIFKRVCDPNWAVAHMILATIIPFYEAIALFAVRNKPYNPGEEPQYAQYTSYDQTQQYYGESQTPQQTWQQEQAPQQTWQQEQQPQQTWQEQQPVQQEVVQPVQPEQEGGFAQEPVQSEEPTGQDNTNI